MLNTTCSFIQTSEGALLPRYNETFNIYELRCPKVLAIKPLTAEILNLRFKCNCRATFNIELSCHLSKKGLLLAGHNFNQKNETDEFLLILRNLNFPVENNTHAALFGDRNQIKLDREEIIGYFKIQN